MSSFGDDLIQAMTEALAHVKGESPPRKVANVCVRTAF